MSAPVDGTALVAIEAEHGPSPGLHGEGPVLPFHLTASAEIDEQVLPWPLAGRRDLPDDASAAVDIWLQQRERRSGPPEIVVTRRPLATSRCSSVFGYADRRTRTAVVSLSGLESSDMARTRRRLQEVISHELGHLAGLGHCRTAGCVMRPAERAEDLDGRRLAPCPACRRRRAWPLAATLLVFCLSASLVLDTAIERIRNRSEVFRWRAEGAAGVLVQEDQAILRLRNPAAAAAAAEALNALYAAMAPPPLEAVKTGSGVRVMAGGREILAADAVLAAGATPDEMVRQWIARIDPFLQGKGRKEEGCPACHVTRREEVLDAMARRSHWWRSR